MDKLPQKYVPKSLTPSQKKKQIKSIQEGKDRPELKGVRKRRSPYTIMAQKYFDGKTSKDEMVKKLSKNKARRERLSKAFGEIIERGIKAYYSSGSRPNVNKFQWGQARLYSVLFNGPARKNDADIVKQYRLPNLAV